jgi:methionyl-tRNA synthetase
MFMAYNAEKAHIPLEGELQIPQFVANHHILFLDKKASSSGSVKPPMADELLDYYTPEQLRMHFISLGLGLRSVSFMPGPLNPKAKPGEADPVTKEGFLLNNVFNRIIRTVLYEVQKTRDGKLPVARPSDAAIEECEQAALQYERFMYRYEFHQVSYVLDSLIRSVSKTMSRLKTESDAVYKAAAAAGAAEMANAEAANAEAANAAESAAELTARADALRDKWLIDTLHGIKTALALLRPVVPEGTELVREYLCFPETVYGFEHIFDTLPDLMPGTDFIKSKFLEPRFDFFPKHPSQITDYIPKA